MAIPLRRRRCGRLAWHGRGTRRHDDRRLWVTLGDYGGNAFLVVRSRTFMLLFLAWFKTGQFQVTPEINRALMVKGFLVLGVTLI
jgi:hypothetical protein